jgi:TolA-binding protein
MSQEEIVQAVGSAASRDRRHWYWISPAEGTMRSVVCALAGALAVIGGAGRASAAPGDEVALDRSASDDLYVRKRPPTPAPVLSAAHRAMLARQSAASDAKRTQAIGLLRELLQSEIGDDTRADAMFKLGELLWQDAEADLLDAVAAYDRDVEACRRAGCAATPKVPVIVLDEPARVFRALLDEFPDFGRADLVTYLVGFAAREDGREREAFELFTRVIETYAASPVVGDAWMMIGEHHFAAGDWAAARDAYAAVLALPDAPVHDLALFKIAWAHWRMNEVETAAREFGTLLRLCATPASRTTGLCDEAVDSLLAIFTEDQQATAPEIHSFLTSVGGERYATDVLVKVGERYTEQADYERAAGVYAYLIEADPAAVRAASWQRAIVDGWNQALDPAKAQAAIAVLLDAYGPRSPWATAARDRAAERDAIAASLDETERLVRVTAKNLHADAQARERYDRCKVAAPYIGLATGTKRCGAAVGPMFAAAAAAYETYLGAFGTGRAESVEVRYLRAQILYFKLGELEAAGDELMVVARTSPVGNLHKPALETAMDAFERARPPTTGGRLVEVDKKFGQALELYARLFPGKDVAGLLYRNGRMFYDHAMYDQAVQRWRVLVDEYPDGPDTAAAADGILDATNRQGDFAALESWAREFRSLDAYAGKDQQARLRTMIAGAIAKQGDAYRDAGRYKLAASTYVRLHDEFPKDPRAPEKLMNAAVMYDKAKLPERAAEAYLRLAKEHASAPSAPKAAFAAGLVYERVAAYDRAADAFEVVIAKFSRSAQVADAVYNAGRLRQALGQYGLAIAHYEDYAAHHGKGASARDVAFNIGVVHESAGDDRKAEQAFSSYAKTYASSSQRVIEAQLRAGRAAFRLGQDKRAASWFAAAIARGKRASGAEHAAGNVWAAEARYYEGELVYRDFARLQLEPRTLAKKLQLLAAAKKVYDSLAAFNEPRWVSAALYRTGSVYDRFADELAAAPDPPNLTGPALAQYRAAIDAAVIDTQDKALEQFVSGHELAKKLQIYDRYTVLVHEALQRLDPVTYPAEREARDSVRVGDHPLPPPAIVDDVRR